MKWPTKTSDKQTYGEEIANAISHGLMILLGIFTLVFFTIKINKINPSNKFIFLIFSISIIILYLMSTLNHSLSFTKAHKFFQKSDHISVYLLIWGTFVPILLLLKELQVPLIEDCKITKGNFLFICQCLLVFLGILAKILWFEKGKYVHLVLYVLLGWSGLLFVDELIKPNNKNLFICIFLGGCFYSGGIWFFIKDHKKYFHFIWHLFVILGTCFHAVGIYLLLKKL
ncbi:hemolysin III family protein [Candidatus Phytoplasma solani]|uniref:PAQR family membrane homeostasis protein TrhA n=1 Tax=Candidatus Phytoplasma solani TaxID=69896 RepID=UPI0032DA7A36